ncbi:hypothetical protein F5Y17DRAFT_456990 [Xylariaceae sp. FL0594]|nr:hypothetical protein F5Y17DRAFT_456990 [Xylariaceae sp. FL0594]
MGFITGFTGGVTLTLSIAYLTVLAHRRNREQQAAILRQQTYVLSGLADPLSPPPNLPMTRAELAAIERANLAEAAKDRWNAEIEHAVKWAQTKDWNGLREDLEDILLPRARQDEVKTAAAQDLRSRTQAEAETVTAAAKAAYADAKAKSASVAAKAEAATGTVVNAIGKGVEKGKEALKSAVVGAGEKVEEAAASSKLSPVERALQQRYERPSGLNQTVEEVLAARYVPIDQRADKDELKGI